MLPDGDHVAVLQGMLLDQLAVDVGAVGAVQVFQEGVIQNVDDQRMVTTHRRIVDPDIVVRKAPNRVALLGHVVFSQNLIVQAKN